MQGHGRIIAPDFCVAHREANSGLSTLNRTKSILSIYHQQRQLQKQRGMCLNDTYPFCQQPLSDNCHSIFLKPVLWTATPGRPFLRGEQPAGRRISKIGEKVIHYDIKSPILDNNYPEFAKSLSKRKGFCEFRKPRACAPARRELYKSDIV